MIFLYGCNEIFLMTSKIYHHSKNIDGRLQILLTVLSSLTGARGKYVDVLGASSRPSPVAPSSLFNVLPKSASMPAKLFDPLAKGRQHMSEFCK